MDCRPKPNQSRRTRSGGSYPSKPSTFHSLSLSLSLSLSGNFVLASCTLEIVIVRPIVGRFLEPYKSIIYIYIYIPLLASRWKPLCSEIFLKATRYGGDPAPGAGWDKYLKKKRGPPDPMKFRGSGDRQFCLSTRLKTELVYTWHGTKPRRENSSRISRSIQAFPGLGKTHQVHFLPPWRLHFYHCRGFLHAWLNLATLNNNARRIRSMHEIRSRRNIAQ